MLSFHLTYCFCYQPLYPMYVLIVRVTFRISILNLRNPHAGVERWALKRTDDSKSGYPASYSLQRHPTTRSNGPTLEASLIQGEHLTDLSSSHSLPKGKDSTFLSLPPFISQHRRNWHIHHLTVSLNTMRALILLTKKSWLVLFIAHLKFTIISILSKWISFQMQKP